MKFILTALLGLMPFHVMAQPVASDYVDNALKKEIESIVNNEIILASLRSQNKKHADLSQKDVDELDQLWRKQRKEENQYFISAVLSNPASVYLTRVQAHSKGKFLEIFVMDNKGLNVGQSSVSSDFWQGDEGKWQKTYLKGKGAVFLDDAEHYKDDNIWAAQYNVAITDPKTDEVLGAATFELNLTELARRKGEGL